MKDNLVIILAVGLSGLIPIAFYTHVPLDRGTVSRLEERQAALKSNADIHLMEFICGTSNFITEIDLREGSPHLVKRAQEKL